MKYLRFDVSRPLTADGLRCGIENGELVCRLGYDFSPDPLTLRSALKAESRRAELRILPYRLELWLDGVLADEEWPCGAPLFDADALGAEERPEEPEPAAGVLGEFTNASGWRPGGGVFVGDCMPYVSDGRYHVLWLKDRHHHRSKWSLGAHQWCHVSSADLVTWQVHPMAVAITDPSEGSICTGSRIRVGNADYLYYTVRQSDRSPAPIRRSVSADGYHFRKDPVFSVKLSAKYDGPSARDPKVILGADGRYHMFVTTSLKKEGVGCLCHLTSPDGEAWSEEAEPIYVHTDERQPECPDYLFCAGRYYLIFSIGGKARYRYSTKPFSDWTVPKDDCIPCHSVPKGAVWNGGILFTGFVPTDGGKYAGTMAFLRAEAKENGELLFLPADVPGN